MKRACLVASDEEDVDGDLPNVSSPKRTRPVRSVRKKVSHFSEDADSSSGDDDDDGNKKRKPIKTGTARRGRPRKPQNSSSSRETTKIINTNNEFCPIMPKPLVIISENNGSSPLVKVEPGISNENLAKNSNIENSASSKDTPSTSNVNQSGNYFVKKRKYERQATPVCDAIMREYSKRQKEMKNRGKQSGDFSDLPSITEIMNKAKKNTQQAASSSKENSNSTGNQSSTQIPKSSITAPAVGVAVQDEHKSVTVKPLDIVVKKEMDSLPSMCEKKGIKIMSVQSLQPRVVIKRENLSPLKNEVQPQIDGNDEEDPTWTPEMENSKRRSRSSKSRFNINLSNISESISKLDNNGDPLNEGRQNITSLLKPNIKQIKQSLSNKLAHDDSNSNSFSGNGKSVYSKERCTFMMEYFTSYQEVFTSQVFQDIIPLLSEILLLCMSGLKECLQRIKNAQDVSILELRRQEVHLASEAYTNLVMSFGERFFNQFDSIVEKIIETKTTKAVMITLIYFIVNSLFNKSSIYKGQLHKARAVLLIISRIYKYHHPLVWEVLEISDQIYDDELKDIMQVIKYYYDRNLVIIPDANLFTCWSENSEKNQHIQSADLSLMNDLVTEIKMPPSVDESRQKYSYEKEMSVSSKTPSCSKIQQNMPSYKLSNMTARLFEKLQNEENYNSKNIENELDLILSYLSDNKNQIPRNFCEQLSEKPSHELNDETSDGNEISKTSRTVQPNNAGLDNLLMPHLKSTSNKIKTEPMEENNCENESTRSLSSINTKSLDLNCSSMMIKEEPEEFNEPLQFASVVIPEPHHVFYSECNDETEENND